MNQTCRRAFLPASCVAQPQQEATTAKAPRKTPAPLGTPENPSNTVQAPIAPAPNPDEPTPGVIDPEANPASNQTDSPVPSSELPTGPLPPSATTVGEPETDDDGKGKPETAQAAIERVKKGEFATDEDRQAAMKRWPNLFAETAKK